MCNRYHPVRHDLFWDEFDCEPPENHPVAPIFPRRPGAFIRSAGGERQAVVGQWGLIPWFAKSLPLKYSTNNARIEGILDGSSATFRDAWKRTQRCIIPAQSFDEPNWESGKNEWWRFRRADGHAWGLAGLWSTWTDKSTGEVFESYTMCTMNADAHPLMRRMHKPDPKLPPQEQDKRSVIAIAKQDWNTWLRGTIDESKALIRLTAVDEFDATADASI